MDYKKKLIEVALPLEAISRAASGEKSIHTGHIANLHTWWSRKPLSASRAVLFASLIDDPSNYLNEAEADRDRQKLLANVERIASWEATNDSILLEEAKQAILQSTGGAPPTFVDPFCGGGSIPLEAQRLGLSVHAADLNPVAVLLTKAITEIAPQLLGRRPVHPHAGHLLGPSGASGFPNFEGFVSDVKEYGKWVLQMAQSRIGKYFPPLDLPKDPEGKQRPIIAWLWTRTVVCPNPACRGVTPLVNKFWLSTHKGNEAWIEPAVNRIDKRFVFKVNRGKGSPQNGTINRTGATCLFCGGPISFAHIREQGRVENLSYRLLAMVSEGSSGRIYLPPDDDQEELALNITPEWVPETNLPSRALGFRVQNYGIARHRDLFMPRQLLALGTFSDLGTASSNRSVAGFTRR